jgi:glycosyltransferase involved in cell wall biosynthesis
MQPSDSGGSEQEPHILVCIPAYNEAKSIGEIIKKAATYASDVIVYDDGSSDNTAEVADAAGATVIRNRKNKGYGVAIKRLFEAAAEKEVDVMVTLDSDGQHNPDEISKIIAPILNERYDVVIGSRFLGDRNKPQNKIPTYRNLGIKTITRLTQSSSYSQITDAQSGFRAYSRNALSRINLFEEGMAVSTEILLKAKGKNLQIKEVPISINYDIEEPSTHNPVSHGMGVLYSIIQFISLRHPLAFYGIPGVAFLIIAVGMLNYGLMVYGSYRHSSVEYIVSAVGFGVVGVVLLATGAILYTIIALLKGRIKDL